MNISHLIRPKPKVWPQRRQIPDEPDDCYRAIKLWKSCPVYVCCSRLQQMGYQSHSFSHHYLLKNANFCSSTVTLLSRAVIARNWRCWVSLTEYWAIAARPLLAAQLLRQSLRSVAASLGELSPDHWRLWHRCSLLSDYESGSQNYSWNQLNRASINKNHLNTPKPQFIVGDWW